jgi:hypothetical protein
MVMPRASLQKALDTAIRRLARKITHVEAISRQFSWLRLAILLLGGLFTWAASTLGGSRSGWAVFFVSVVVFAVVVLLHRRLESWLIRFRLLQELKSGQKARMELDWQKIPQPPSPGSSGQNRLEIDLDLAGKQSIHHLICMAFSPESSLLLAEWLSQAIPDLPGIIERQALLRELIPMVGFRDRLYLAFRLASRDQLNGTQLLHWLEEEYPSSRLRWALPVASLFVLLNIALFLLNSAGLIPAYWVFTGLCYIFFYFSNASILSKFLEAILHLDEELPKFRAIVQILETYPLRGKHHLSSLCQPFRNPHKLPSSELRKMRLVTAAVGLRMNFVFGFLLNLIFPWDFTFAWLADRYRRSMAQSLPVWFRTWNKIDALISLANFGYLNPDYSFPEFIPAGTPVFEVQKMGHPLIPVVSKVRNDFTLRQLGQVVIITGSNMAGKSTFIKTIGINLCLAYAGGPVDAACFRTIPFRLHPCIHITDSVVDGFSFFYAEVKCLKSLLDELQGDHSLPLLSLIDEIFRGTNNRERLIGSRSYIREMIGKNGVSFISTHDLELAGLAQDSPNVINYHFRDTVADGRLVFDYQIQPGPSPTTNALVIMRMEGLPVEPKSLSKN